MRELSTLIGDYMDFRIRRAARPDAAAGRRARGRAQPGVGPGARERRDVPGRTWRPAGGDAGALPARKASAARGRNIVMACASR
jgi:hypothetical protein